jgi:sugar phosphate isomerase/epimerase
MIDGEGDLASSDEKERNIAVENHKKWVDAAHFLGCHSIRVNLFGSNNEDEWTSNATKGLEQLAEYGKSKDINVIVENHGGFSSNAELLSSVIRNIDMDNCGTLPDFGNFCVKREGGGNWDGKCIDEYDKYKGIEEMMPYAKGVSAKSYDFDVEGNETTLDYPRFLKIVKDAGYTGYIGVEFEGSNVSEEKGIELTRNLLLKTGKDLSK